jgi:dihydrofolate synthase/folylpolyglutamate synthase
LLGAPALSLITPIALDHQDALGATLAEIAAHKAGILKPGAPAIIARQADEAHILIEAEAARIGAPLYRQGVEWDAFASAGRLVVQTETRALDLPLPALYGAHQIDNAGLACAALMAWRHFGDEAFAAGVSNTKWSARLQPLTRGPFSAPIRSLGGEVWVDGGHNAHAGQALAHALAQMKARRGGTNVAIVGLRARKDAAAFVEAIEHAADHIIAVPLSEAHAPLDAISATQAPTLAAAMQSAARFPAPRVLISGSFLLAAEALAAESA